MYLLGGDATSHRGIVIRGQFILETHCKFCLKMKRLLKWHKFTNSSVYYFEGIYTGNIM